MTKCLFFCGKGKNESAAIRRALGQCEGLLLNFPSLVVELVELVPNAAGFDAHIRVMAISNTETKQYKKSPKPSPSLEIKPSDDLGRREGVEHEANISREDRKDMQIESFDLAATAGVIPDLPTQDFDEFKGLGLSVEEVRLHLNNRQTLLRQQQQLKIDSH
jgi:hypothetical protein